MIGVVGMEDRTRLIGGDSALHPAKPHGILVYVDLPKQLAASAA